MPWNWEGDKDEGEEPQVIYQDRVIPGSEQAKESEVQEGVPKPRRYHIRSADVRKYGFTKGCPKCEAIMVGGQAELLPQRGLPEEDRGGNGGE